MLSLIQKFDSYILLFIKDNMHGPIMDKVMLMSTYLGNGGIIWIILAVILIISKKYRKVGFMAIAALILSTFLGEGILKHIVKRIRPSSNIPSFDLLIQKPLSYSFPSGHTGSSFAVAGVLSKYIKEYTVEFFFLAFLIAFSRLYLYLHYPTDVLAGAVLGLISSRIIIYIFNRADHHSKTCI
ncbi:phosphatase PAP2 family protein [Clostridium sp.]